MTVDTAIEDTQVNEEESGIGEARVIDIAAGEGLPIEDLPDRMAHQISVFQHLRINVMSSQLTKMIAGMGVAFWLLVLMALIVDGTLLASVAILGIMAIVEVIGIHKLLFGMTTRLVFHIRKINGERILDIQWWFAEDEAKFPDNWRKPDGKGWTLWIDTSHEDGMIHGVDVEPYDSGSKTSTSDYEDKKVVADAYYHIIKPVRTTAETVQLGLLVLTLVIGLLAVISGSENIPIALKQAGSIAVGFPAESFSHGSP